MKKLNITKEAFERSKYFKNKYGKLEYVSESGKVFKTKKGKILMFKESKVDLKGDKPNSPDFKSWAEVEREIRAAIKYAEHKGHEACTVFDIGTWDQRNNKTLQEIIAKFKAKGYSCRPYAEKGSGYGYIDDGLGLSIVWGSFLESSKSTKKFGKKFDESMNWNGVTDKFIDNDTVQFTRNCPSCGKPHSITVSIRDVEDGMSEYGKGARI